MGLAYFSPTVDAMRFPPPIMVPSRSGKAATGYPLDPGRDELWSRLSRGPSL